MAEFEAVIGLEVHAQLLTTSKLFCACSTRFGNEPNTNVCPVCSGHPGVLPVMNERALEYATRMALATGCTVNERSIFARKNYFYPDLPKAYQISQYEEPLAEHGHLEVSVDGETARIGITRIHMEEDAGKSIHSQHENVSFVDLNRCGVPLIEIVSEPDIRSAEQAAAYLKELRAILVYLGICDGNMEEGSFRCDANVSVRPKGQSALGTRTEIKNMNSFRNVQRAIDYEIERHIDVIEAGEDIVQETRQYIADKNVTQSMRSKEEAHDYRYFPDPDILPIVVDEAFHKRCADALPELPRPRMERFISQYGLPEYDAELLTADRATANYFEAAVNCYNEPKKVANWIMSETLREMNERQESMDACRMTPDHLAALVKLVDQGVISIKIGKDIFRELYESGAHPEAFCKDRNLIQISGEDELACVVDEVIAENPDEAARLKGGEKKLMSFFMGQVMRKTRGKANPKVVQELFKEKL